MAFARQIVNRMDLPLVTDAWLSIAHPFLKWWYSRLTQSLYERTQNGWAKWRKKNSQSRRTRQADTRFVHTNTTIPKFSKSMDSSDSRIQKRLRGTYWKRRKNTIRYRISNGHQKHLEKQGWTTQTMRLPPDKGASFVNDIANNNGKMVCDGLFKFGRSSSAFLSISKEIFIGTNIVPGCIEDQSAYQGELGGILGSLVTMRILCNQFGVTHGAVTIGVDCEGAIKACEGGRLVSC